MDNIETDWFSVLEFDDEYSKIWFKNVQQYIDYYEDVDLSIRAKHDNIKIILLLALEVIH